MSNIFKPGKNCWRVEHADRSAVLIDGENYFRAVRKSLAQAKQRIMLLGWDFDERVEMHDTAEQLEGPLKIGAYFDWLLKNNRDLDIYVLRWDTGAEILFSRKRTDDADSLVFSPTGAFQARFPPPRGGSPSSKGHRHR